MKSALTTALIALLSLAACSDNTGSHAHLDSKDTSTTADTDVTTDAGTTGTDTDAAAGDAALGDTGTSPDTGGTTERLTCGALPLDDSHTVVHVSPDQATQLPQIVREAASGTTIMLDDGTYKPGAPLQFRHDDVTLRSASNDATKVVIDGEYKVDEIMYVISSNVTIAHVTIKRAVHHLVHVFPGGTNPDDVTGTLLYGLRLIDGGEQFVKVNTNGDRTRFADDGRVECSYFRMTDAGRPHVERNPGGCYTGGIDTHSGQGWQVRNNEFHDIYCAGEGLAEHAVHFWSGSRDTLVENNTIVNCARGVGFGLVKDGKTRDYPDNPYPNAGYIGHFDGIIRNNVIYADNPWFDTGIELDQARGARVYHNTVYSTDAATGFFSSIDYRFANTDVDIRNNLVERITQRNGATGQVDHNLENIDASLFVDATNLDFHLVDGATDAIDQGVEVDQAGLDMDGEPHTNGVPDLGADEH